MEVYGVTEVEKWCVRECKQWLLGQTFRFHSGEHARTFCLNCRNGGGNPAGWILAAVDWEVKYVREGQHKSSSSPPWLHPGRNRCAHHASCCQMWIEDHLRELLMWVYVWGRVFREIANESWGIDESNSAPLVFFTVWFWHLHFWLRHQDCWSSW